MGQIQNNNSDIQIAPDLAYEYERYRIMLGHDERCSSLAITATEVLKAHFLLADYFRAIGTGIGGIGPKSIHLLHSAVSRQCVGFGSTVKWTDLFSVAAHYSSD